MQLAEGMLYDFLHCSGTIMLYYYTKVSDKLQPLQCLIFRQGEISVNHYDSLGVSVSVTPALQRLNVPVTSCWYMGSILRGNLDHCCNIIFCVLFQLL